MYEPVKRPKENRNHTAARDGVQEMSNAIQCFGFNNNRLESTAYRKLKNYTSRVGDNSLTQNICNVKQRLGGGGSRLIQRMTLLSYAPAYNRPAADVIAGMHHARVAMTDNETQLAALYSGYATPQVAPGNCKHYVPYAMIKNEVYNQLTANNPLNNVAAWLNGRAMLGASVFTATNATGGGNYNLGAQPAPDVPQATVVPLTFSEQVLNTEVDDFIKNLANDPRNLYYRTNSSGDGGGTLIDRPLGHGARTLLFENTRLENYRNYLQGLGLNV